MHPNVNDTLVPEKDTLRGFALVFDAVYTPLHTRLLQVGRQRRGKERL